MSADNIKNISKIHHVKYTRENNKLMYHVWQYYGIGIGKSFPVGQQPCSPKYTVTVPFQNNHLSLGKAVKEKKGRKEVILCSEPMCIKTFESVDQMLHHLDFETHLYASSNVTQLSTVSDKWVKRFSVSEPKHVIDKSVVAITETFGKKPMLEMGWAIPKICLRKFSVIQKNFLNEVFDDGEKNKCKVSPEQALKKMKERRLKNSFR